MGKKKDKGEPEATDGEPQALSKAELKKLAKEEKKRSTGKGEPEPEPESEPEPPVNEAQLLVAAAAAEQQAAVAASRRKRASKRQPEPEPQFGTRVLSSLCVNSVPESPAHAALMLRTSLLEMIGHACASAVSSLRSMPRICVNWR